MQTNCDPLPGFASFRFAGNSAEERCVYHAGKGPAVLVMHELPGLTPACISLAEDIAAAGFTVYLPLLFGRPGQNLGRAAGVQFVRASRVSPVRRRQAQPDHGLAA